MSASRGRRDIEVYRSDNRLVKASGCDVEIIAMRALKNRASKVRSTKR